MARIWSALAVITCEQAIGIEIMEGVGDKQQSLTMLEERAEPAVNSRRRSLIQKNVSPSPSTKFFQVQVPIIGENVLKKVFRK